MIRSFQFFATIFLLILTVPSVAQAQSSMQKAKQDDTHIRITADRPAIVKLEGNATSVIVGNPAHAAATLDNENTLIVNPVQPGATSLVVLDDKGDIILEKTLLINPPKSNYIRVNRICSASTRDTCRQTSMYYCTEGCHEMVVPGQDVEGGMASQDSTASSSAAADDGMTAEGAEGTSTEGDDQN